ncbi:hypothetical protein NBRC10512_001470 [Rhodotorula toruloides]|uniref:BTB/POZ-like domain containing protein n=1 Tax=Rhodotorula toruloides (strain NP11) TaxID=1130832 RepID=M7WKN7_RHOT1|nr:BTB/POZ-like domain containing protein [Rhodotorula toruloides NP11]EMS18390.1 BTB/POZ-like domain containing protein [Rhodotorula toruloides NP11]
MPTTPEPGDVCFTGLHFDSSFRHLITVNLALNLTNTNLAGQVYLTVALPSQWSFTATSKQNYSEPDSHYVEFIVEHGRLEAGALGSAVCTTMRLRAVVAGREVEIKKVDTPPQRVPTRIAHETNRRYILQVLQKDVEAAQIASDLEFSQDVPEPSLEAATLTERIPHVFLSPMPYDVRFHFSDAHEHGAELWAESAFLERASPYFRILLASDFAETAVVPQKRPRTAPSTALPASPASGKEKDFDDSDDETDGLFFQKSPPQLFHHGDTHEFRFKQITVTQTAFTTYRAVLAFLRTGHISFAPLSSSSASRDTLCLTHFSRSLMPATAPIELVNDASVRYDAWRKVVIEYIVERWDEVMETESWKDVYARIERDEIPGSGLVLLKLMDKKLGAGKGASFSFASSFPGHLADTVAPCVG